MDGFARIGSQIVKGAVDLSVLEFSTASGGLSVVHDGFALDRLSIMASKQWIVRHPARSGDAAFGKYGRCH